MRILTSLFFVCLFTAPQVARALIEDGPSIELLPVTPQIEATAAQALQGCVPQVGKITGEINKNGIYTLAGDLFHNGHVYTLIDDTQDVILCEWQKPAWKPISAINAETEWNWPNGYRKQEGRTPDNQPRPFWILNLQGRPLLVIASQVDKAGQNYSVILFDSKCQGILSTDYSFGQPPEVKHQYLITGDGSRNKAEWEGTYYSKIQNEAFVVLKSWEDSQPWHAGDQPDDPSNYASSGDKGYNILPDTSGDAHPADYLIYGSNPKADGNKRYDTVGKPVAAIYFTPDKNSQTGGDGLIYLFQKLTGLPKDLFPGYENYQSSGKPSPKLKIKVTGTDEGIIRLLSPAPDKPD